jgi:hypothetical protein
MGTYCELYVADYPIFPWKSQAYPVAMTLFREYDKIVAQRSEAERNKIQWGHAEWNAETMETVVEYRSTVSAVKDRLRVMGFTMERVEKEFREVMAVHLEHLREMSEDGHPELWEEEIALLSKTTLSDFLNAFRFILRSGVHYVHIVDQVADVPALVVYMLKQDDELFWGFPCRDFRYFIRCLLEVSSDDAMVTQELTDLVDGGYYELDSAVTELALQELKGSYPVNSPIIVLTEGPTDNECISAALSLLYPHLAGYFSFMDLAARTAGGAGSLVHVVRSFAGARIENRVVALFDNDTAGTVSADTLRRDKLPASIRILQYPDIDIARRYPTIGPTGNADQDVNGAACSVEMYFGRDVLAVSGTLVPVMWKGREDRLKRYQGELQERNSLKTAFLKKLAEARARPALIATQDWGGMRLILDALFDAFSKRPEVT